MSSSVVRTVFMKELRDALRDRRTWLIAMLMSLLTGPAVFSMLVYVVSEIEEKTAAREIVVAQAQHAPTLINYLQRAGATVKAAPGDYAAQLRSGKLQTAVVVPAADFEAQLAAGQAAVVDVYYDDSHERAHPLIGATLRLLSGFNRELGLQRLMARGVSPYLLLPIDLQEKNLAPTQARGAQLLFIVPWAALLVGVFGALPVAIDVTAGERERGSLEPLLMNPIPTGGLVLGKWAVVLAYGAAIIALTLLGFFVSIRMISNETLSALMELQGRELLVFAALLLPFAGMMAAMNMLAATFGRSYKEAQTYVSFIAMTAQFSAIVPVLINQRDAAWQLYVPSVGQLAVLMKTLRGEALAATDLLIPNAICVAVTAICLMLQTRLLARESIVFAKS